MSNYGHNYGSLEQYAEEQARQRDLKLSKTKEVFTIARLEDEFFLSKNGEFTPFVTNDTVLAKNIGTAFDIRDEAEAMLKQTLRPKAVYVPFEIYTNIK